MKKRIFTLICICLFLGLLTSCGTGRVQYKYDRIPGIRLNFYDLGGLKSRPIKGGSFGMMLQNDFLGEDIPRDSWGGEVLFVLFDEEAKVLFPVCGDVTCLHEDNSCFAKAMLGAFTCYWNVSEDSIVVVSGSFSREHAGEQTPYTANAYYFSFDGTLLDSVSYDLTALVRADGELIKSPGVITSYATDGERVFLDLADAGDIRNRDGGCNRWLIEYDLSTRQFRTVCNYLVPDMYTSFVNICEFTETHIGVEYDRRFGYCIDRTTGEYVETDCTEILAKAQSAGEAPSDGNIGLILPIKGLIKSNGYPKSTFISMDTGKEVEVSEVESSSYTTIGSLYYEGELYYHVMSPNHEKLWAYQRAEDEEPILISRIFEDGAYSLNSVMLESEKGVIYQYYKVGETYEDEQIIKEINGRDVLCQKAASLVYVEKSDMFDGTVDSPWYYDGETGTFVRPE